MQPKPQINPNAIYSLSDLRSLFGSGLDVETFLQGLGLTRDGRIFRNFVFGQEILAAVAREIRRRHGAAGQGCHAGAKSVDSEENLETPRETQEKAIGEKLDYKALATQVFVGRSDGGRPKKCTQEGAISKVTQPPTAVLKLRAGNRGEGRS